MIEAPIAPARDALPPLARRHQFLVFVGLWLLACVAQIGLHWHNVSHFAFPDVDDQLRLVEVRDWLGGQAFTDVAQYRMNQPAGAPMHWSRLVDIPIAALILLVRPLLGQHGAETAACIIVPLATLGLAMRFTGLIARRLAGPAAGLLATVLAGMPNTGIIQMQPMRIDHHGWEIVLSLAALCAALDPRGRRGGLLAGLALGFGLQISLEVLPFAVTLGGALGVHWALTPTPDRSRRLAAYGVALASSEALLFLLLHGPAQWGVFCDAVSPPHLLGLGLASIGLVFTTWRDPASAWARFAALAGTALVAAAAFHAVPPGCGLDAFSSLEPIVRTYWYEKVGEGLPIWHSDAATGMSMIGFPVLALPCALFAWRETRRSAWGLYGALLLAMTALAVMVLRAEALANFLAIPAIAWAALRLLGRIQASPAMLVRVFGSTLILLASCPWTPAVVATVALPTNAADDLRQAHRARSCSAPESVRALAGGLPSSRLFAPIDLGPLILLETPHAVLASGHHRNHAAIADELRAWLGSDATAHAVLRRHGLRYVVSCAGHTDIDTDMAASPRGFAAHLVAGRVPAWLVPVPLPGSLLRVWKVVD